MRFLVTGGAGFIGSNIVETLLDGNAEVVVLDNLSTGKKENIESFENNRNFTFIEGTITDQKTCVRACDGADYVFHEAALCSVPLSIEKPEDTYEINIKGTSNVFLAAREAGVKRVVWASSTSVYGNPTVLPNVETMPLCPLSPYAASKAAGEMLASAYSEVYGIPIISLRYFNVFGKRQDPNSFYAAVVPRFISLLMKGNAPTIYGDGLQTRDFVHIENVVQANIKAATQSKPEAYGRAFNIGGGTKISINELYSMIAEELGCGITPQYSPGRPGEVRDSFADIGAARSAFGYDPAITVREGLKRALVWYKEHQD
ncbi:SDR family oxidoreductase [bacterium]|nr:SDR family oxidoreductase [bacterium]